MIPPAENSVEESNSQATKAESADQRDLLSGRGVQRPDLLDGHDQDGDVGDDVGHRVADEGALKVDALAGHPRLPRDVDGVALEDADEDDGDPPRQHGAPDDVGGDLEAAAGEDAQVHLQQRELDERHGRDVHALEAEQQLEDVLYGVEVEGACVPAHAVVDH